MWTVIKTANGKFRCELPNSDTTDQTWDTEAEALAWATKANENHQKFLEENKARAADRRAKRAGIVTAADMFIDPNAH